MRWHPDSTKKNAIRYMAFMNPEEFVSATPSPAGGTSQGSQPRHPQSPTLLLCWDTFCFSLSGGEINKYKIMHLELFSNVCLNKSNLFLKMKLFLYKYTEHQLISSLMEALLVSQRRLQNGPVRTSLRKYKYLRYKVKVLSENLWDWTKLNVF